MADGQPSHAQLAAFGSVLPQSPQLATHLGYSWPTISGSPEAIARASQAAMAAHISEHVAFAYRAGIEKELGTSLPGPEEKLPEDEVVDFESIDSKAIYDLKKQLQGPTMVEVD